MNPDLLGEAQVLQHLPQCCPSGQSQRSSASRVKVCVGAHASRGLTGPGVLECPRAVKPLKTAGPPPAPGHCGCPQPGWDNASITLAPNTKG
jgi:hypothetical protein